MWVLGGGGRHATLKHENARKKDLVEIGRTYVLFQRRHKNLLKILCATFGRQQHCPFQQHHSVDIRLPGLILSNDEVNQPL